MTTSSCPPVRGNDCARATPVAAVGSGNAGAPGRVAPAQLLGGVNAGPYCPAKAGIPDAATEGAMPSLRPLVPGPACATEDRRAS